MPQPSEYRARPRLVLEIGASLFGLDRCAPLRDENTGSGGALMGERDIRFITHHEHNKLSAVAFPVGRKMLSGRIGSSLGGNKRANMDVRQSR